MPRRRQRLYRVYLQGQGDLERQCVFTSPDQSFAEREADHHLRSWVTSHSVEAEPTIWIEFDFCLKVYEAWTERRRVEDLKTGDVFLETPIQFWREELRRWGNNELKETPMRTEWFNPLLGEYEELEPLVNSKMYRN
jgi:hypothetical protein